MTYGKVPTYLNRNAYNLLCSDRPEMKQEGGIGTDVEV